MRARSKSCSSQFRLRLLQPEAHVHLAVHRRGGGEVLLRLLALARAPVELAEAEVAVGDEGAQVQLLAEIASHRGPPDDEVAERHYRQALALAGELEMRPLVAHCHLGLGKLYRRTGKRIESDEHFNTAATMYREMGMTYWLEKAEAEMRLA